MGDVGEGESGCLAVESTRRLSATVPPIHLAYTPLQTLGSVYEKTLLHDYPWRSLKASSFVDCAGGQGYLSIGLSEM